MSRRLSAIYIGVRQWLSYLL